MPIHYLTAPHPIAVFEGTCQPEEADALLEWLRATPAPRIDLAACQHLHTALLQLLLASGAAVAALPPDPLLACCLMAHRPAQPAPAQPAPAQPAPAQPAPAIAPGPARRPRRKPATSRPDHAPKTQPTPSQPVTP